jgi:A/G-specific adenine glycosylase
MTTQTMVGTGEPFHALGEALEARRLQIQEGILTWSANNPLRYPWRQPGRTPYEVLVGEAWLKLTSSTLAVRIYQRFVQQFLSVKALAEAEEDNVAEICRNFGLGRSAEYIKMMVNRLLKEGKGRLPSDSETFARTTGLEQYHIQAIFCFGYGMPIAIVDDNVARMLSRLFRYTLPYPPAPGLLQTIGENLLPFGNPQCYNCGLLDLAELICRNKNPLCPRCPVDEFCDYAESLPQNNNPYPVLRDYVTA